jgi:hypothetical protein
MKSLGSTRWAAVSAMRRPPQEGQKPRPVQLNAISSVSIAPVSAPSDTGGLQVVGAQLQIEAPPASANAPLVITLTVDASAIPDGVDPGRLDVTHNDELIDDCSGAPGSADPDPCIDSRVILMDGNVQITILTSHASLWGVVVRGLFNYEQKCVNGVSAAAVKVAKAQSKVSAACLKAAAHLDEPDAQACLASDGRGKVAGARQKTVDIGTAACGTAPPFGFTSTATSNDAAQQASLDLIADLFGSDLSSAVATDKPGAKCQAAVLKGVEKVFETKAKLFLSCLKDGLAGKTSLMVSAPQLTGCFTCSRLMPTARSPRRAVSSPEPSSTSARASISPRRYRVAAQPRPT